MTPRYLSDSKDKAPSENASTIVIATTPKSPDLKSPTKEPQPHGDENEGKFFRQPVPHARCFRFRGLLHEFKCLPIEKSIFVAAPLTRKLFQFHSIVGNTVRNR